MIKKNKVLVMCQKYPPIYSGYGNQAKSVFNSIVKNSNIKFIVITANYSESKNSEGEEINVKTFGRRWVIDKYEKLGLLSYSIESFFWMLLNAKEYSLIHCISGHSTTAIPSILAGTIMKKKVIVKITQAEYRPYSKKVGVFQSLARRLRQEIVSKADVFIAISQEIKDELIDYGISKDKIINIPNGADSTKHYPVSKNRKNELRKINNLNNDSIIILYAGALNRRKGTYDLLEAIKILDQTLYKNVEVVLCGPDHEEIYKNYIVDKDYPVRVTYKGSVKNLDEYYQMADIFVLPSYSEGLPNVLLEAAMCGLALVASDIGGNRDIILNSKLGILYPVGNVIKLSEAIQELVNNSELRIDFSNSIYEMALKKFSLTLVSEQYQELYSKLIE